MHLYVLARANKPELDRWVNDLLAQYVPYEYAKGKTGSLQVSVRPIQLFEIVYPKKIHKTILAGIQPYDDRCGRLPGIIRKLLGLKPIRHRVKPNDFAKRFPHVSIIGIGTKEDRMIDGIEEI